MAGSLTVRVPAELRLFVAARHRSGNVQVAHDGTASVGHVVTSLGVPLTEVGGLLVGGRQVGAGHRPRVGDVIDLRPVSRPQPAPSDPPRFLLDVHLGTLARRLRLLGIDAAYRNDAHDDELVQQAHDESRVLLSRDRGLLRRRAVRHGAYVHGQRPDDQLVDMLDRFDPPLRPWSRCLGCNGVLEPVRKIDILEQLKPGTRRTYHEFARCDRCGRVYWPGAHHARLSKMISAVAPAAAPDGRP